MKVLLLAGTAEARALAGDLDKAGVTLVASLAGVTERPAAIAGQTRSGGFGGVAGLTSYLREAAITHVIDATHPFAVQMSTNAVAAAAAADVPLLQLIRPAWPDHPDWVAANSLDHAARLCAPGEQVFLSTGRGSLHHFKPRNDVTFFVRVIDDLPGAFPLARGGFVIGRPPFSVEEEMATLKERKITTLVSRNSGGTGGLEKLLAAQRLGIRIIMVARPDYRDAPRVQTTQEALDWVASQ